MNAPPKAPLAVALHYEKPGTPRVIAKGKGEIGQKIIETARAHGVPIEENAGLVQLLAPRGEQILRAGELVNVRWHLLAPVETTPTDRVTFELELSTDGGAEFLPVVRTIPGRVQGLRWRVPNLATRQGRLRIVAKGPGEQLSWDGGLDEIVITPQ